MKYTLLTHEVTVFGKVSFERERLELPWLWLAKLLSRFWHFDNGRSWSECYVFHGDVPVWFSTLGESVPWSECYLAKSIKWAMAALHKTPSYPDDEATT